MITDLNKLKVEKWKKEKKPNNYLTKYQEFLQVEGGLSSDPTDRRKSKKKYHTNKGVRWETFKLILPKATYKDFLEMNDSTYLKIIKYHERAVSRLIKDTIPNDAVKLFLIEELWAAGNLNNYIGQDLNDIDNLYEIKDVRYSRLLRRKPYLNKYKKGWKRRRIEFREFNEQFIPIITKDLYL